MNDHLTQNDASEIGSSFRKNWSLMLTLAIGSLLFVLGGLHFLKASSVQSVTERPPERTEVALAAELVADVVPAGVSSRPDDHVQGQVQQNAPDSTGGYCQWQLVNLRRKPNTSSERVSQILYGQRVRILAERGSWLQVQVIEQQDYPGWVTKRAIMPATQAYASEQLGVIANPATEVKAEPDRVSAKASGWPEWLPGGSVVNVVATQGDWTEVASLGGASGWIRSDRWSPHMTPKPGSMGATVVERAQAYMRTKYLWGGITRNGIDCSGLVWVAHFQCGLCIPRDAKDQAQAGTPVNRSDLRAGDCVFFATKGSTVSHVGIFIGNDDFLHSAPSGGVHVSSLRAEYYGFRYLSARRLF
jgi:gamma-D-glutamyl-L-lysine dipeptidyl-peptidase